MPDFLTNAKANTASNAEQRGGGAQEAGKGDFDLEPLPPVDAPMDAEKVSSEPPPGVDFKLDLADLDVNASSRATADAERDDHWYDVQQKFELAKAYEEMGDKSGARDILQEVVREGDKDQQAQAKKLLDSLS
jgi:pilus assembly protein FimV